MGLAALAYPVLAEEFLTSVVYPRSLADSRRAGPTYVYDH